MSKVQSIWQIKTNYFLCPFFLSLESFLWSDSFLFDSLESAFSCFSFLSFLSSSFLSESEDSFFSFFSFLFVLLSSFFSESLEPFFSFFSLSSVVSFSFLWSFSFLFLEPSLCSTFSSTVSSTASLPLVSVSSFDVSSGVGEWIWIRHTRVLFTHYFLLFNVTNTEYVGKSKFVREPNYIECLYNYS